MTLIGVKNSCVSANMVKKLTVVGETFSFFFFFLFFFSPEKNRVGPIIL